MKTKLLLFFLFTAFLGYTQTPWRAKIFVHFLDSNNQIVTDTVWFGSDSLGDIGYQPGLDVVDTFDRYQENKVYFEDRATQTQLGLPTPYNLKTSIKAFNKNGLVTYRVQAFGYVYAISWDTTEFIYEQPDFNLNNAVLKCYDCYIGAWERESHGIFGRYPNGVPTFGGTDSIDINQGGYMQLDITLRFKDTSNVGVLEESNGIQFSILGNPSYDYFTVQFKETFTGNACLLDNTGRLVQPVTALTNIQRTTINISHLTRGLYYLQLIDKNNNKTKPVKILKL